MEMKKLEASPLPSPFEPYGTGPVTVEGCTVREGHALHDEAVRYHAEYSRIGAEHDAAVERIKSHFHAERMAVIARNFAEQGA